MEKINRVLIGMELSDFDDHVLSYASYFCSLVGATEIYFEHVEKRFYVPEDFPERVKEAFIPMDESEKADMQKKISKYFDDKKFHVNVSVDEGDVVSTIAHKIEIKDIDLVIIGTKGGDYRHSFISEKILRKSKTSVLLIPEGSRNQLNDIFIPFDFSDHGNNVLEVVSELTKYTDNLNTDLLHVYDVPKGYYKTGKSFEEMDEIISEHIEKKFHATLSKYPAIKYNAEFHSDEDNDVADLVMGSLEENDYDLLIMGSKGQTNSAAMLLGSNAEKMIRYYLDSPILIIKEKGENMGFLKALFEAL